MMLAQIFIGSITITATVLIQVVFIGTLSKVLSVFGHHLSRPPYTRKFIITLVGIVLWLVLGLTASSWLWALLFLLLGAFESLEPAIYFSVVTFTTLGYGDITLSSEWRLLGGIASLNGLIIVGLNTAFLVEVISRINKEQARQKATK
jgi:hypothetical protein